MSKRSDFPRRKNDFYRTFDPRATRALAPHLAPGSAFYEPCAGDGSLVELMHREGHLCVHASDTEPSSPWVSREDAFDLKEVLEGTVIVTNPPWTRAILQPLIVHFSELAPTWLLFDADWAHTRQAIPYLPRLRKIVSVGRLRWIEGTAHDGKDNCAWYLFGPPEPRRPIEFAGRLDHAVNSR